MAQQISPFLEAAYGWNFGEGGWNSGMDQNLLKFSFMFDRNVDSIVASLPPAINGQAHYLTTDNRLYFAVGTTYFSTPVPKWFTIYVRGTGQAHQFDGATLNQIDSPAQIDSRLDAVELTVASLGTAAFEDVEFFATQSELDVVEAKVDTTAFESVTVFTDVSSLLTANSSILVDDKTVRVLSYHPSAIDGGGLYRWDSTTAKTSHNGGTVISPTVPWDGLQASLSNFLNGTGETNPTGFGCWLAVGNVDAKRFGAVGNGVVDDTAALQALLSAKGGDTSYIPNGNYVTSLELLVDVNNSSVVLGEFTTITYNTPTFVAMRVTGSNFKISGGILGGFTGPASWDGTNVTPTYAVILITGDNAVVDGIRLTNVKKLGVWFKDIENGTAMHCRIDGNYPTELWTEVETVHFGIHFDPDVGDTGGNFIAQGNLIRSCVQGVFAGNYGTGQEILGLNIVGNVFEGCWNHGVYSTGCRGASITGNTFNRCEIPIALTGPYNTVTGNSMYTKFTGVSDLRDITGISMRDSIGCVVANNTIKGDAPANSVIIDFQALTAGVTISDNIVANNVVEVAGGSSIAIRMNTIATTTSNNIIEGNVVSTIGRPNFGAIQVNGTDGGSHLGNTVRDNTIKVKGQSHGVSITFQTGACVAGNTCRFEYDAPSAQTLVSVLLTKCVDTAINNNKVINTAAFGTNVTLRGIQEQTAGSTGNTSTGNESSISLVKLAAFTDFVLLSGSLWTMDESGSGVPAYPAGAGSIFRRKDGGADSTLYIRETSSGSTWVPYSSGANLSGSTTYDPPSLVDGAGVSTTVTVTGAALGDFAMASFSLSTQGIIVTADVTAANTVTVRFQNETGGTIDLASGTLRARVQKA